MINIVSRFTGTVLYHSERALTTGEALVEANGKLAKLYGASLDGASWISANLVAAQLDGASLTGANLVGTNFDGAHLNGVRFVGADLARASFIGANVYGANFKKANLKGATLDGVPLDSTNLDGANFDGALRDGHVIDKCIQIQNVAEYGAMLAYTTKAGELRVEIGCRKFSMAEAKVYWASSPTRKMTRVALGMAEQWYAAVASSARMEAA